MRFDIITLFPDMLSGVLATSILRRAQEAGHIQVHLHDLRTYATDKHRTVDDTPYGGGAGMLLKVDVLVACLEAVQSSLDSENIGKRRQVVLLCPQGNRLNQGVVEKLASNFEQITLICGHYEGFDERIRSFVDTEISIGDFVLTGGELPALTLVDAVSRLVPGVITESSPEEESHSLLDPITGKRLLEYPHYTRPAEFRGLSVPEILTSGNHAAIATWRLEQARKRTEQQQS